MRDTVSDRAGFLRQLAAVLGPRGLSQDADLIEPWLTDWRGRYVGKALALASPETTRQTAQIVGLCTQYRVPIVPQGGNSGMSGGATPDETGMALLLSTRRMNAVRSFDVEAREIVCEAGVVLQTLHDLAGDNRLRFPLTLGGKGSATIGGLIATNAGGTQVLRHGSMRAQVKGLEAVMPDGEVFDALATLKKDNRGFDLKQLLIGSEGTLGIITAATLRLLPESGARVVAWVGLPDIGEARRLLLHCQDVASDTLEGFEVVPRHCLQSVLAHQPTARDPLPTQYPWNALIEFAAPPATSSTLSADIERLLEQALDQGLFDDAAIAVNERQADAFWELRDGISAAERAIGPAMQHDISVPVARMADFIDHAVSVIESRFAHTRAVAFGHLGDGNVHLHVLAPPGSSRGGWENEQGKEISGFVHDLVTQWQGSISAEHGIGQMKRAELARLHDPVALSMMRAVKNALDPQNIMNPGKLVDAAPATRPATLAPPAPTL